MNPNEKEEKMRKEIIVVFVVVVVAIGAYVATLLPSAPVTPTSTQTSTTTPTSTPTSTTTPTPPKLKIAVIYTSPLQGETWNLPLDSALKKATQKYGLDPYNYTESVAPPDADRIARTYISDGFKLIFLHSWFPDTAKMIGKEFPDVVALPAGGGCELTVMYPPPTPVPPNIGHYDTYLQESAYLAGIVAGKMTKTNKIGLVGGFPVANANRYFNGFIQGAKEANENVQVQMTWILSWSDPPKAKEAAEALIEWGADFIASDRLPGPESATEAAQDAGKNIYCVQINYNSPELAPKSLIMGVPWILDKTMDDIVSSVIAGKFVSKEYVYGLAQSGTDFIINLKDKVPADVQNLVGVLKQEIIEGKLVITPNNNNPEQVWGI